MALYQKYRPKTLAELVGQEFVKTTLQATLKKNQVAHAYLFFGSRGTGKTSSARILAKALNCLNPDEKGDPCNTCDHCVAADAGNFVDLIEIDGASNRKIEHARALIEKITFAPTLGKRKVYIIDEIHMLTKEAFNALLKTIEEPPDHAFFLLATTELNKVPETIRSRCQVFTFHRFTPEEISDRLQYIADSENIRASRDALLLIAKKSVGGLRDAIGLFEQAAASGEISVEKLQDELGLVSQSQLQSFFALLSQKKAKEAFDFVAEISSEGLSLSDFLEQFLGFLREQMMGFVLKGKSSESAYFLELLNIFDEARKNLKDAVIPTLPLEIAIMKVLNMGVEVNMRKVEVVLGSSQSESGMKKEEKKETGNWKLETGKNLEKMEEKKQGEQDQKVDEKIREEKIVSEKEEEIPLPEDPYVSEEGGRKPEKAEGTPPLSGEEKRDDSPAPVETQDKALSHDSVLEQKNSVSGQRDNDDSRICDLKNVKAFWGKVLNDLKDSILKAALRQSFVSSVENDVISISFSADSWKAQVEDKDRISELLRVLRENFHEGVDVELNVEKVILEPVQNVKNDESSEGEKITADMISDIFGTK